MTNTFIEACLSGSAQPGDIGQYVADWHDSDEDGISLAERLGFTETEYFRWVEDPDYLPFILAAHRYGTSIEQLLGDGAESAPLRALNRKDMEHLQQWLKDRRPAHSA